MALKKKDVKDWFKAILTAAGAMLIYPALKSIFSGENFFTENPWILAGAIIFLAVAFYYIQRYKDRLAAKSKENMPDCYILKPLVIENARGLLLYGIIVERDRPVLSEATNQVI